MSYKITTGCLERGTEEQKAPFIQLLGENTQFKFDFYFHWYNIVHEYGHCLFSYHEIDIVGLPQEIFVNRFAVSYWKARGFEDKLKTLRKILEETLSKIPCPVPDGEDFIGWYEKIWGTELMMSVPVYGYLQFKSVLLALEEMPDMPDILKEANIEGYRKQELIEPVNYEIKAETALKVLTDLVDFLDKANVKHPDVSIELTDDPSQHYCRYV